MSKKRLGRGLGSIMSTPIPDNPAPNTPSVESNDGNGLKTVGVTQIHPSPYQPRRHFAPEALQELSASIANQGLLQPLVVRARAQGGFELVAGERRWRASQMAGLTELPVLIKSVSDREASALALIENMQREDLNALEEALGLARLRDEFELTQQEISEAVGKSRATVANLLRLVNLGSVAKQLLESGQIEMGHARALLATRRHTTRSAGHPK